MGTWVIRCRLGFDHSKFFSLDCGEQLLSWNRREGRVARPDCRAVHLGKDVARAGG